VNKAKCLCRAAWLFVKPPAFCKLAPVSCTSMLLGFKCNWNRWHFVLAQRFELGKKLLAASLTRQGDTMGRGRQNVGTSRAPCLTKGQLSRACRLSESNRDTPQWLRSLCASLAPAIPQTRGHTNSTKRARFRRCSCTCR